MANLVHKRQAAEIIEIKKGGRTRFQYEGAGRWINEAICQVMLMQPSKWFSMKELALLAFRSAAPCNQTKARRRIAGLFHYLFRQHKRVLIREFERRVDDIRMADDIRKHPLKGRNIISRVKIVEIDDVAQAESELEELARRNEITRNELAEMRSALKMLEAPR